MLLDGRMIQRPLKPEPDLPIIIVWIIGSHEIDLGTALSCVDLVEPFVQFLVAHSDSKMDV